METSAGGPSIKEGVGSRFNAFPTTYTLLSYSSLRYNTIIMPPPSATGFDTASIALQPQSGVETAMVGSKFPSPRKFDDKYKEREYLKGRLILAYRIFAKLGYDEGVAGHITLRVRFPLKPPQAETNRPRTP